MSMIIRLELRCCVKSGCYYKKLAGQQIPLCVGTKKNSCSSAAFSNREAASLIAERFRKLIGNTVLQIGNEEFRVTCSIGFAVYPFVLSNPEAFTWEQVIAFANRSLVASKRSGRNSWVGLLTTKKSNSKDFDARNFANLRKCIDQGELSVVTSLPTSSIQW